MNNPEELRIKEGFPRQRLIVFPSHVVKRCRHLPMVRHLFITDIGAYPLARHHYVERKQGASSAILIYCQKGAGSLQIDKTLFNIHPGQLLIIPPDTPHIYQADSADPWSILWIQFTGEQTQSLLNTLGVTVCKPLLYVPDTQLMCDAFEDVYACLNYHYSDAGLLAMTSELMRLFSKIKLHQGFAKPQRQSAENRVAATQDYMERHLDTLLTLEQMAAHSGQSVSYYSKLFKERTSQSPMAWFIQLKIRKACELLDQTELTVGEIATELGYNDPYYFSRIFKKVQGCSPAAYRHAIKG